MKEILEKLKSEAIEKIENATQINQLEEVRIRMLGKKGALTEMLRSMGKLSAEERPLVGKSVNEVKVLIEKELSDKKQMLEEKALMDRLGSESIDITLPGKKPESGTLHPITKTTLEIQEIFASIGFSVAEGPEIDFAKYNFDYLNTPENHPSRGMNDTFYISEDVLLRTQTSPVQVRVMEKQKPPIRIISPGRVYRSDEVDATHSPVFHQIEGLVVDRGITFSNLKSTLETMIRRMYGENSVVRFRPHHFPFTEPSAEVDVQCFACHGRGCRLCKGEGWIELLGCGMVHPKVLSNCGIDPEVYSGFAFGMGLERLVMRKYQIDDMRLFHENDVRFLSQF